MRADLQALLSLLVFIPVINTTSPDIPVIDVNNHGIESLHIFYDPAKDITSQLAETHLDGAFESKIAMGANIWAKTLDDDMGSIVKILDTEICNILERSNDFNSAAALIHGFLEASDSNVDKIVESIVKTALISRALNLLRTLQHFYIWSSLEQFHWFQALGYKSEWYDPVAWKDNPVPMDWSNNLAAICKADNPTLLHDIFLENPLISNIDTLPGLIAEHDSLNIYQYLTPTPVIHLKILSELGSFKILRHLAESKSIDLHLEDYPLPSTLPEDFKFFWMQGYRYLPANQFLSRACELGRVDIIEFLCQQNPCILESIIHMMSLATRNGHFDVLEWASSRGVSYYRENIAFGLITNGHFKVFERLQGKLKAFNLEILQWIINEAAEMNQLKAVKWTHEKFKVVPGSKYFGNASIEMLEWVELVSPQTINEELAERANLASLKWLSNSYPHLLSQRVKSAHNKGLVDFEKMQWMIFQGWEASPDMQQAAREGKVELLEFGYKKLQIRPTEEHANIAAGRGKTKILELIYSIDRYCITRNTLLNALEAGHLETAKFIDSTFSMMRPVICFDLYHPFNSGQLELIEWAYQHYKLDQPSKLNLDRAIRKGSLEIVNWALKKQFILKSDEEFLKSAASYGQHLIFQRLVDFGIVVTKFENLSKIAFRSGSLEIVRYLARKDFSIIQLLRSERVTIDNYHIAQWLKDANF